MALTLLAQSKFQSMMKKSSLLIVMLLLLMIFSCTLPPQTTEDKKTIVSMLVVREDSIRKKSTEEVLPIGLYHKGKYEIINEGPYWDLRRENLSESYIPAETPKNIFKLYKSFTAVHYGEVFRKINIERVEDAPFLCGVLPVGIGKSKEYNVVPQTTAVDHSEGFDLSLDIPLNENCLNFSYNTKFFIAINSDAPAIQERQRLALEKPLQDNERKLVEAFVIEQYEKEVSKARREARDEHGNTFLKIDTVTSFDLENDGRKEIIVVANYDNQQGLNGTLRYLVRVKNGRIQALFSLETLAVDDDMNHWEFNLIDVVDIDNDSVPEFIFYGRGYESMEFQIFKYENQTMHEVFHYDIINC